MKKCFLFLTVISLVVSASSLRAEQGQKNEKDEKQIFKTQKDKLSYSIGWDIGNSFKKQSIDINPDILLKGINDNLSGKNPLMDEKQMGETIMNFQKEMMAKRTEAQKKIGEKNKKEGEEFLGKNKSNKGVVSLPSGLQYRVIKEGTGKIPKLNDTVVVHYKGTLIDGTEFDSSYNRGEPAKFPVSGIIRGWTEALQLMKVDSKWELFIPSHLAYGERGAGDIIGPNTTLIFTVELLGIEEK